MLRDSPFVRLIPENISRIEYKADVKQLMEWSGWDERSECGRAARLLSSTSFIYHLLSFRTENLGLSLIAVFGVHGGTLNAPDRRHATFFGVSRCK